MTFTSDLTVSSDVISPWLTYIVREMLHPRSWQRDRSPRMHVYWLWMWKCPRWRLESSIWVPWITGNLDLCLIYHTSEFIYIRFGAHSPANECIAPSRCLWSVGNCKKKRRKKKHYWCKLMGKFPGVMKFLGVWWIGPLTSSYLLNVFSASSHTCVANVALKASGMQK